MYCHGFGKPSIIKQNLLISALCLGLLLFSADSRAQQQSDADKAMAEAAQKRDQQWQIQQAAQQQAQQQAQAAQRAEKQQELDNQRKAQEKAQQKKQQAAQMAQLLGTGLTAVGTMMMMSGQSSANPGLTKAGLVMMLGGMAANLAAMMMNKDANTAGQNASNLDSLGNLGMPTTSSLSGGFKTDSGSLDPGGTRTPISQDTSSGKVGIDAAGLQTGPLGDILDKFEQETGIPRADLANALANGVSPADILNGHAGLTKEQIQEGLDKAKAESGMGDAHGGLSPSVLAMADKIGMGDMAKQLAEDTGADFEGGADALANNSASSPSSSLDLNALLAPKDAAGAARAPAGNEDAFNFDRDVNPALQKQMAEKGLLRNSLFDIISSRYRQMTPVMLGYGPTLMDTKGKPEKSVLEKNL